MRLRGINRLRAAGRSVRRQFRRRAVVLLYHRVATPSWDPFCLSVSPFHFKEQLEVIRRVGQPIPLASLAAGLARGMVPRRAVVVTFDDGYLDNLLAAAPELRRQGVPATVFVPSGFVGTGQAFWWDALTRLLEPSRPLPSRLNLTISGQARTWVLEEDGRGPAVAAVSAPRAGSATQDFSRLSLLRELHALIRPLPWQEQESLIKELRNWAAPSAPAPDGERVMTDAELRAMTADGLIEVGAHTVRHPVLAAQSAEAQAEEIQVGRQRLESWLGRDVTSFAYPFGARGDYGSATVAALREQRFTCACANFPGAVSGGTPILELPRHHVLDCGGREFERQLLAWMDA
jgi:peptidoglycan/xylan/chitin deacetylase (PgdA/CDA1 family)